MAKHTIRPSLWQKRKLTVEAIRYDGTRKCLEAIEAWTGSRVRWDPNHEMPVVCTPQGTRWVNTGDWVVTGVAGEVYPIQSDIFEMSYDPADAKDFRSFLSTARVLEIQAQSRQSGDPVFLRELLDLVVASHEALQA
jgi:hypothetical protein